MSITMSLIQTVKAAGVSLKLYVWNVLLRIGAESDVKKLRPHTLKEHFEAKIMGRLGEVVNL